MATSTELYINAELPKRIYTDQFPLTVGHVPVATGNGLEIVARQLDVADVANAASQQDITDAIDALIDNAPAALDTLNELAAALGDDANYASTVATALGNRLRVDINTQGLTATEQQNGMDNLGVSEVITGASIDGSGVITFTKNGVAADDTVQVPTAVDGLSFNASTGVMTLSYTNGATDTTITVASNEIADNVFRVKDNVDGTKKIAFEASGIATATTRTITMPNKDVDLGSPFSSASYSSATENITFTTVGGATSNVSIAPTVTYITTHTTLELSRTYVIGNNPGAGGSATPVLLTSNLILSLPLPPIPNKFIIIDIGYYSGTITLDGSGMANVHNVTDGSIISTIYGVSGMRIVLHSPTPWAFPPQPWIASITYGSSIDSSMLKLTKLNDQTKALSFALTALTANRAIIMPDADVNLGTIPVIHSANGNSVTGTYAAITSGLTNTASGQYSSVLNGTLNIASGGYSTVLNGGSNTASGNYSVASGADSIAANMLSSVYGDHNTIPAGTGGTQQASRYTTIVNGFHNTIIGTTVGTADYSTILNGSYNSITGKNSVILNGSGVVINKNNVTVLSGSGVPAAGLQTNDTLIHTGLGNSWGQKAGATIERSASAYSGTAIGAGPYSFEAEFAVADSVPGLTISNQHRIPAISPANNRYFSAAIHTIDFFIHTFGPGGFGGYAIGTRRIIVARDGGGPTVNIQIQSVGTDITTFVHPYSITVDLTPGTSADKYLIITAGVTGTLAVSSIEGKLTMRSSLTELG